MQLTVLQILPALDVGGVERGTLEIAQALVKAGHRSIVISAGGRLVQQLRDEGSEHIDMAVGKKSLWTLKYVQELRALFRKEKVSVVHARSRLPAWISWLAWHGMNPVNRPRFITTVHGPYSVNPYSRIMVRGERIIAISEFIRDYILKNYSGIDPAVINVIPRGVAPEQFPHGYKPSATWLASWQEKYPHLAGKFLMTLPARITRWKGHEDFIEILQQAVQHGLSVHALVAGAPHGRRQTFYEELIRKAGLYGLANHITFLGHRDDLREIMAVSDVVFSLAQEPEAFGRTALEALSLGVPVIAYDHGGASEVLSALFPAGRVSPLNTRAAFQLLEQFIAARPVVPARNPFTLERMTSNTLALYERLCADTSC